MTPDLTAALERVREWEKIDAAFGETVAWNRTRAILLETYRNTGLKLVEALVVQQQLRDHLDNCPTSECFVAVERDYFCSDGLSLDTKAKQLRVSALTEFAEEVERLSG